MLRLGDGQQIAGEDLRRLVEQANTARSLIQPLIKKVGNAAVIEQAAIAGALNPEIIPDQRRAAEAASYIARRLDLLSPLEERGWVGTAEADVRLQCDPVSVGFIRRRRAGSSQSRTPPLSATG